jgi:hypothetical protein
MTNQLDLTPAEYYHRRQQALIARAPEVIRDRERREHIAAVLNSYPRAPGQPPQAELVVLLVCAHQRVDPDALLSGSKRKTAVRARDTIAAVLRRFGMSHSAIGRALCVYHGAVIHAVKRHHHEDAAEIHRLLKDGVAALPSLDASQFILPDSELIEVGRRENKNLSPTTRRVCLQCNQPFDSHSISNRRCDRCVQRRNLWA